MRRAFRIAAATTAGVTMLATVPGTGVRPPDGGVTPGEDEAARGRVHAARDAYSRAYREVVDSLSIVPTGRAPDAVALLRRRLDGRAASMLCEASRLWMEAEADLPGPGDGSPLADHLRRLADLESGCCLRDWLSGHGIVAEPGRVARAMNRFEGFVSAVEAGRREAESRSGDDPGRPRRGGG